LFAGEGQADSNGYHHQSSAPRTISKLRGERANRLRAVPATKTQALSDIGRFLRTRDRAPGLDRHASEGGGDELGEGSPRKTNDVELVVTHDESFAEDATGPW
jgi:hypothetical protein